MFANDDDAPVAITVAVFIGLSHNFGSVSSRIQIFLERKQSVREEKIYI